MNFLLGIKLMSITIRELCNGFDLSADKVRHLSKDFCDPLGVTTFGYVRIYPNGCVSWVTSNPDQDRFLIESGALNDDPLINTPEVLKDGHYLWFNDRQFPGSDIFYRDRAQRFQMDHGLVIMKHQKNYLETCCFSGLLAKQPLYNLFMNERAIFDLFMEHFTRQLDRRLQALLEQGITIGDIKTSFGKLSKSSLQEVDSSSLVAACGNKNLLKLSKREKECLVLLKQGHSYQAIGMQLKLSARTVEHYIESVKNKLGLETRAELYFVAELVFKLKLLNI
jgi:DNA-binding CsgD family transcriptional regulator